MVSCLENTKTDKHIYLSSLIIKDRQQVIPSFSRYQMQNPLLTQIYVLCLLLVSEKKLYYLRVRRQNCMQVLLQGKPNPQAETDDNISRGVICNVLNDKFLRNQIPWQMILCGSSYKKHLKPQRENKNRQCYLISWKLWERKKHVSIMSRCVITCSKTITSCGRGVRSHATVQAVGDDGFVNDRKYTVRISLYKVKSIWSSRPENLK